MSVRKVVTRRGGHTRGLMPSIKNAIAVAYESQHELHFYQFLELSPLVLEYLVQPTREKIEIDGTLAVYIPDVRAKLADGKSIFFEVKPALKCKTARVAKRLEAIRKRFQDTARRFFLVSDEWLNQEPRQSNIIRLMYHRREFLLDQMERARIARLLVVSQPKTISDLMSLVGSQKAWLLLGLAIVGVDLECPLNDEALIFIEGGHRHAHFYA